MLRENERIAEEWIVGYQAELDRLMEKYGVSPTDVEVLPLPHKPPPAPSVHIQKLAGILAMGPVFAVPVNYKVRCTFEDEVMKVYSYILEKPDGRTMLLMYASNVPTWTGEPMIEYFRKSFERMAKRAR